MSGDPRFQGDFAKKYDLFKLAVPHHDEFQAAIASAYFEDPGRFGLPDDYNNEASGPGPKTLTIVELGCGHGETTRHIIRHLNLLSQPYEFTAIDSSAEMIECAIRNSGISKNRFIHIDVLSYLKKCPDCSVHAVLSGYFFHNLNPDDRCEIMFEIARVLTKKGVLVIGDKIADDRDLAKHELLLSKQLRAFAIFGMTAFPELELEWIQHYLEDDQNRLTRSDLSKLAFHVNILSDGYSHQVGTWGLEAVHWFRMNKK